MFSLEQRKSFCKENLDFLSEEIRKAVSSGNLKGKEKKISEDLMSEIRDLVQVEGCSLADISKAEIMISRLAAIVVATAAPCTGANE